MVIKYKKPSPLLAPLVAHYWEKHNPKYQEIGYEKETVFPETYLNLTFSLGTPYFRATAKMDVFSKLQTPQLVPLHTEQNFYKHQHDNHIFGIKFLPGGLYPFVPNDFVDLTNTSLDMSIFFGKEVDYLAEELYHLPDFESRIARVEIFLMEHLLERKMQKLSFVKWATSLLFTKNNPMDIGKVAAQLNSNYKSLSRAFHEVLGVSPKQFAQLQRFEKALYLLSAEPQTNCTEIGYRVGYYDQAHFIREFKKHAHLTPTEYLEQIHATKPDEARLDFQQFFSPEHLLFYQMEVY